MNVPITELIVIVLLTLLEAFFVAAEIALVSIRRSRVDQLVEEDRPGARRVRRLLDEPGRFLAVSQLGLTVIASAPLMQARLTRGLPAALGDAFPTATTDPQRAIEFTRTLPGITAALVGMKQTAHVAENLGAVRTV